MKAGGITTIDRKVRRLYSCAIFLAVFVMASCTRPAPAKHPAEVAEIPGTLFTVRISEFPEDHGGLVAGAYYRFESLPSGGKTWVSAMEFRHDDAVPIPRQDVRFLTPRSAIAFMGWKYAVTTDGGNHWHVWNARRTWRDGDAAITGLSRELSWNRTAPAKCSCDQSRAVPVKCPSLSHPISAGTGRYRRRATRSVIGPEPKFFPHYRAFPGTTRLFLTENTPGTPLARIPAKFLSDSRSTTPSSVTFPWFTMMRIGRFDPTP